MIENAMLSIIYLLFAALVVVSIVAFTLIIVLAYILSKEKS